MKNKIKDPYGWISVKDRMPEKNISVIVFIPEEDHHVTTGMWDVSKKWVLLDEYRVPQSEVTYWQPMIRIPLDTGYTPCKYVEKSPDEILRDCQKRSIELERKINHVKILSDCIDFTSEESFRQDVTALITAINNL